MGAVKLLFNFVSGAVDLNAKWRKTAKDVYIRNYRFGRVEILNIK
jgi:hypothetical protein